MIFGMVVRRFLLLVAVFLSTSALSDPKKAYEAWRKGDWSEMVRECRALAEAGNTSCQYLMGQAYKSGLSVSRDLKASASLLTACASKGYLYCEEALGDSYRLGLGVEVNYIEAARLFRLAISRGSTWGQNNLGNLNRHGQGMPVNKAEAVRLYRLAADKGNPAAQANLSDMYRLGEGVEKSGDEAYQLALKSSQQNWGNGWNVLGLLHLYGVGVRQDTTAAISAFKKAVEPSVRSPAYIAYGNLAGVYYHGRGVPVDLRESAKWAEIGVRAGNADSMVYLANILNRGAKGVAIDRDRAFQLARQATELGHRSAKNTLAVFYRDGVGTSIDLARAVLLFNEAIDQGDINAAVSLGRMLLDGKGVEKDSGRAHQYFLEGRRQIENLGPGNRAFVESYFAQAPSADNKPVTTASTSSIATQPAPSNTTPVTKPPGVSADASQQLLLDRLEKMQKQLETLQASANTLNQNQVAPLQSQTAVRRALVIGNDKYRHVPPLNNAREDAAGVASALGKIGYSVVLHQDVDERRFKQVLREFRAALEGGEEVLFYFAGHGVQLGSANYLLPIDVKGDHEDQVRDEAIELQRILDDMKSKSAKFSLAIIDACRDNPFKGSGRSIGGRGLAPTTAATGQMIMFSAGAGQQALDKLGPQDKEKNGVFTRVLLREMVRPGVPVDRVLRNVRNEVVRLSKSIGHEQTPALYDQAVGDFFFTLK